MGLASVAHRVAYRATITSSRESVEDAKRLIALFKVEQTERDSDRASFAASSPEPKVVQVDVEAQDSVALRATLVTITKILTVHDKVDKLAKEDKKD